MTTDFKKIESVARVAAERAAAVQKKYWQAGFDISYKGEFNLVTQADVESQKVIMKTIVEAFPDHQILGEENDLGHNSSFDKPLWIIDPIDGTTNYAHRFPIFASSIAYVENNQPQFGLIHLLILGETFHAVRGQGAYQNNIPMHVSKVSTVAKSHLTTGFSYERRVLRENNLDYFEHFEMNSLATRIHGCATFDPACTASGTFDDYWQLKLEPWDIAAGILIVEEAGGKVSDFSGKPITDFWCGEVLATNGLVHDEMVRDILRIRKEKNLTSET